MTFNSVHITLETLKSRQTDHYEEFWVLCFTTTVWLDPRQFESRTTCLSGKEKRLHKLTPIAVHITLETLKSRRGGNTPPLLRKRRPGSYERRCLLSAGASASTCASTTSMCSASGMIWPGFFDSSQRASLLFGSSLGSKARSFNIFPHFWLEVLMKVEDFVWTS